MRLCHVLHLPILVPVPLHLHAVTHVHHNLRSNRETF